MSRWIDYDAIDYRFDRIQDQSPDFIGGVVYANACVVDAPSIDIVRCGECRYYIDFIGEQFINAPTLCGRLSTLDNYVAVKADDFCSYGEREGE